MVEYLNVCRNEPRRFEASASRGGVVRGTVRPPLLECKLNSNSPLMRRVVRGLPPLTSALHSLTICLCLCPGKTRRNPCLAAGPIWIGLECDQLLRRALPPRQRARKPPGVNSSMCSVYVWSPLLFISACAPSPPFAPSGFPRGWIIQCFNTVRGRN